MSSYRTEILFALFCLLFAGLALGFWIPGDIESGIIEKVRRREKMGDALFPTALAVGILLVSLVHLLLTLIACVRRRELSGDSGLHAANFSYLLMLLVLLGVSFLLMTYAGPGLVYMVSTLGGTDIGSYRELRDTVPYKYAGFASGGFLLVFGLISLVRGRPSGMSALIAAIAVILLIAVYDLPFEDLLLPPNGDQ